MEHINKIFGSALVGAVAANLGIFASASIFNWPSPIGPKLSSNDSTINSLPQPITMLQGSLITSIMLPGCLVGTLSAGVTSIKFGKKSTLLMFGVPMLVGHLMCAFAKSISVFLAARFLMGIGAGCEYTVLSAYVSEIANDKYRGAFGTLISVLGGFGNLFVYILGPVTSIRLFSLLNVVPLLLFFLLFSFCAESPYELLEIGNRKLAKKTLMRLRNAKSENDIRKELCFIEETVREQTQSEGRFVDFFKDKTLKKALTLTCTIMVIQQFSGIPAYLAYMQTIFESSQVGFPSEYSPILVSISSIIATTLSSQLMDRLGRKLSLIVSMICLIISNATLASYFYLKSNNFNVSMISWLPVLCVIAFFVSFALGLASVPWILVGEYFPASHKHLALSFSAFVCFFFCGIVTLAFPFVNALLGDSGSFWIFSAGLSCGLVFVWLVMPETKGMTFLEVQDILGGKSIKHNVDCK